MKKVKESKPEVNARCGFRVFRVSEDGLLKPIKLSTDWIDELTEEEVLSCLKDNFPDCFYPLDFVVLRSVRLYRT